MSCQQSFTSVQTFDARTRTVSHTQLAHSHPSHKQLSHTQLSHTHLFHTICLPPSPQNSHILFQMHSINLLTHTQPSHTELSHSICLPRSSFSFLPFPSRLHRSIATYWKKLTCGVIRPFNAPTVAFIELLLASMVPSPTKHSNPGL